MARCTRHNSYLRYVHLLIESLFHTYRLHAEYGFGLSYSSFSYSNIQLESSYEADQYAIQETNERYVGQKEGQSLYDQILLASIEIKNTGDVVACEVAQLVSLLHFHLVKVLAEYLAVH